MLSIEDNAKEGKRGRERGREKEEGEREEG
jgi:hypothetical protein